MNIISTNNDWVPWGEQPALAEKLFDCLPDIVFFIKDTQGRYLTVNETLVERCGLANKPALIGQTAVDVLGQTLGQRYVEQDLSVIKTGQALIQFLELHNYRSGELGWCLTTKLPITDASGQCTGLIGISQDLKWPDASQPSFVHLCDTIKTIESQLDQKISIREMAEMANLSLYQLDRRMKMIYGLTAGKWLLKTRISLASERLIESQDSILDIAFSIGYSDQSAFTKQFKNVTGLSPHKFRKINQKTNRYS